MALFEEEFLRIKKDADLLTVASMISLAFGTESAAEILYGSAGMLVLYWGGGSGLNGAISALAGVQIAKRKFTTVTLPTLVETYKIFQDYRLGKSLDRRSFSKIGLFIAGFFLAVNRFV